MSTDGMNTMEKFYRFCKEKGLRYRNLFALVATVLFLVSISSSYLSSILKFVAYFCGMVAYTFELLYMTKGFSEKNSHEEMFMVYCFAPLYLLLGISYLLH